MKICGCFNQESVLQNFRFFEIKSLAIIFMYRNDLFNLIVLINSEEKCVIF